MATMIKFPYPHISLLIPIATIHQIYFKITAQLTWFHKCSKSKFFALNSNKISNLILFHFKVTFCFLSCNYMFFIYIFIYRQTVSLYHSVARQVGHLKLWSKPTQLYVRLSIIPLSQQVNHISSGIIRH